MNGYQLVNIKKKNKKKQINIVIKFLELLILEKLGYDFLSL